MDWISTTNPRSIHIRCVNIETRKTEPTKSGFIYSLHLWSWRAQREPKRNGTGFLSIISAWEGDLIRRGCLIWWVGSRLLPLSHLFCRLELKNQVGIPPSEDLTNKAGEGQTEVSQWSLQRIWEKRWVTVLIVLNDVWAVTLFCVMAQKGVHWTADEKNDCYCCLIWICIYSSRRIS